MLALGEFTVESLQKHSGITPGTVRTVLRRKEPILERIGFEPKGHPGGTPIRYRVKPEAETALRDELGELFAEVRNLPDDKLRAKAPTVAEADELKAPLALLAAENALLKQFPNTVDLEEKQELLKIAEQNIRSGNLELKAIAGSAPEKVDSVRALLQSVKALAALSRAEMNVASGRAEDAFRTFPAIYQGSAQASNALQFSGQTGRAAAFSERVWASPLIKPLIEKVVHGSTTALLRARASAAGRIRFHNINSGWDDNRQTIAVLPLTGKEGDQTYIYDGLTRGIWGRVCELPLTVVNPSRVLASPIPVGDSQFVRDLGRKLNVQAVLFGNVSVSGKNLSCTAKFLSVESGSLWQKRYETKLDELFSLEEDISKKVSEELHIQLTEEEKAHLEERPTKDSEAHRLYMEGRYRWMQWTAEGIETAIDYFEQALKKDRSYARAYAGLADCYNMCTYELGIPPGECFPKAKAAAHEALEFDENLAEAYTALAYSRLRYYWNWEEAEESYLRAIDLNPNYTLARLWYAEYLAAVGRFDEAIIQVQEAGRLDPESLIISVTTGSIYYFAEEYDLAIAQFEETIKKDEGFIRAHFRLGGVYLQTGNYAAAIKELTTAVELSNHNPREESSLGYAYAVSGDHGLARKVLAGLKRMSRRRYVSNYNVALIYAGLGELDSAFKWLDWAFEDRDPWLVFLKVDPRLSPLRGDDRFEPLIKRIGLPTRNEPDFGNSILDEGFIQVLRPTEIFRPTENLR